MWAITGTKNDLITKFLNYTIAQLIHKITNHQIINLLNASSSLV